MGRWLVSTTKLNIKKCLYARKQHSEIKRRATDRGTAGSYLEKHTTDKVLVSRTYKELLGIQEKKTLQQKNSQSSRKVRTKPINNVKEVQM